MVLCRGVMGQGRLMLLALVHRSISKVFAHVFPPALLPPETFVSRLTNDSALRNFKVASLFISESATNIV